MREAEKNLTGLEKFCGLCICSCRRYSICIKTSLMLWLSQRHQFLVKKEKVVNITCVSSIKLLQRVDATTFQLYNPIPLFFISFFRKQNFEDSEQYRKAYSKDNSDDKNRSFGSSSERNTSGAPSSGYIKKYAFPYVKNSILWTYFILVNHHTLYLHLRLCWHT